MEILNNHIVVKPIASTTVFNKGQKKKPFMMYKIYFLEMLIVHGFFDNKNH
jgi:hypothetical protein